MKIYKVAQVPPGYVEVEITIGDDGTSTRKIVGHGPNETCDRVRHKDLMNDAFSTEVDGFYGPLGEVDTEGLTAEGIETIKKKKQKATPLAEEPFKGAKPIKAPGAQKGRAMDTGFGV